jgi:8-oxo-dGTP pyrophosphatase MutT (NUDIX family)
MAEASSEPATPRPAATVILLRRGAEHSDRGLEVCMARRNPEARFMPGVWVFPGGGVDNADGEGDGGMRAAAAREVAEEVGIEIDPSALVPYSRWVTPEVGRIRFDTVFYLALAPAHSPPEPDNEETVDAGWFNPREALDRHYRDELPLVFPTIKHLESLLPFSSAEEALEAAAGRSMEPVLPRVEGEGDERRIVLPEEWGEATPIPKELR